MAKDERIDRGGRESAVNSAVGGLLSGILGAHPCQVPLQSPGQPR
jgi:hypothetical protein